MRTRLVWGTLVALVVVGIGSAHAAVVTANIHISNASAGTPVDTQLLAGTNLPAWIGPKFHDPALLARATAGGVGVIRIPGGSWSDDYGWLSCEMGANQPGAYPCGQGWEAWAATPTDFVNFLRAVGKSGDQVMYTMNVNVTAQEAAAAVAFFNALPSDATPIGTDIHGTDWHTAGYWAQLRTDHGNPTPLGIKYWEFGNEIYGGNPANGGTDCVSYGWENSWTCDGTEYVNGIGSGATRHEGYLEFRTAMRAVDPTIRLGAVGTEDPADYANWGNEVIAAAGSVMDFYVVHPYAYYIPPPNTALGRAQILAQPDTNWHNLKTALQAAFDTYAGGRQIPIAATEYNLVSVQDQDTKQLMTRAVNALFVADSIGQALVNGFAMANQWDLSNGCAANHTCYDLLQVDHAFRRAPQYYTFPLWARFGSASLPVTSDLDPATQLSAYAGRIDASTLSLLAINKTGRAITGFITFDGGARISAGTADVARAGSLAAKAMSFNNRSNPANDLSNAPALPLKAVGTTVTYSFRPMSITLLRMTVAP